MGFAKYSVPAPCYNKHKSDMKLACHYEIDQIFFTILFKKQYYSVLKIKQDIDILAIQKPTKNPCKFHEF